MGSNLGEPKLNILFAKLPFGMNVKGHENIKRDLEFSRFLQGN